MSHTIQRWFTLAWGGLALIAAIPAMGMSCMMMAAPRLVFGEYNPKSPLPHDVQGTLSIQCTPATPGEIVDLKGSLTGLSDTQLYAHNPQTGDRLRVGLYRDPARSQLINPQELFWFRVPLAVSTTLTIPLYGRIPAGQDVAVGSYQADFTVLLDF